MYLAQQSFAPNLFLGLFISPTPLFYIYLSLKLNEITFAYEIRYRNSPQYQVEKDQGSG